LSRFRDCAGAAAGESPDVDSFVNDVLRHAAQQSISYDAWFCREIAQAVREADAGDFATDEEAGRVFDRRP